MGYPISLVFDVNVASSAVLSCSCSGQSVSMDVLLFLLW
jgi:hypothetical protein